MAEVSESRKGATSPAGFGTIGGVFTPCTLTILGVIMFLRFGFVVGEAGIWHALLIVLAAKAITTLTALSLCAIATNTRVKGGGPYYLISRSLGVEFGGAIGLVFYLAQAVSVSMYVIGFAEAYTIAVSADLSVSTIATITNIAVFLCVFIGAGWTIKVQYVILAVLVGSLVSFYVGAAGAFDVDTLRTNLAPSYSPEVSGFFVMFALFFPAVTGIMAGANMSGDLKDPARSIPVGTLWAILATALIYISLALLLGGARSQEELVGDTLVMSGVSRWPTWITAGVFAATISSAIGAMIGAPRILQAFARDNVIKFLAPFAVGDGQRNEPRRAIVFTFVIAQICILSADLNTIAPLITMFFMVTYGLLNLATFYEGITKNPSYRPRFRFSHWSLSLLGAVGCIAVMVLIDWRWASVSLVMIAGLHYYISRKEVEARWGDLQSGLLFERARQSLLRLEHELYHPKNWRPIILALGGAAWTRPHLAVYGHWLTSGHGILTLAQVVQGEPEDRVERRAGQERVLHNFIREENLQAFPVVVVAPDVGDGIESLVQCQGLGALRPNTVLLGWPTDVARVAPFGSLLRTVARLQRNIISVRFTGDAGDAWLAPRGTIDVWWRGQKNGDLLLLLAHMLRHNNEWRTRKVRLLRVIENEAGRAEVVRHLTELAAQARIPAVVTVLVSATPVAAIQRASRGAAIVFFGFEAPEEGQEVAFYERMERLADVLPRVVLVDSVGEISLES